MRQQRKSNLHMTQRTYGVRHSGWAHIISYGYTISQSFLRPQSPTDRILPHPPSSPHHPHHQTLYILDCSFNPAHNPHTSTLPTSALKSAHLFHLVQPLSLFKDAECRRDWGGDTRDYQWTRQRNICTILSPKKSLPRPQHLPYFCCCSPPPHNNKPSQRNSISNF